MYKSPEKQRLYQTNWVNKRRNFYLENKKCLRCKTRKGLVIAGVVDAMGGRNHAVFSLSPAKQAVVLKKCRVLCKSCRWKEL